MSDVTSVTSGENAVVVAMLVMIVLLTIKILLHMVELVSFVRHPRCCQEDWDVREEEQCILSKKEAFGSCKGGHASNSRMLVIGTLRGSPKIEEPPEWSRLLEFVSNWLLKIIPLKSIGRAPWIHGDPCILLGSLGWFCGEKPHMSYCQHQAYERTLNSGRKGPSCSLL